MPFPLRLQGRISPAILAATFAEILRRHEVLRAIFRAVDGAPVMEIAPLAARVLALVDLTALPGHEREEMVRRLVHADVNRPFDLARGPLLRLSLVRLADEDHVLLLSVHHIVFDGWSSGILVRELTLLYRSLLAARSGPGTAPPGLEELPIQYADFAHWQRERLREEGLKRQIEYWTRQLAGAPTQLELASSSSRASCGLVNLRSARTTGTLDAFSSLSGGGTRSRARITTRGDRPCAERRRHRTGQGVSLEKTLGSFAQ